MSAQQFSPHEQRGAQEQQDDNRGIDIGAAHANEISEITPFPGDEADSSSYRDLFACTAEGVVIQDVDGRIIDANPAALQLLGLTKSNCWASPHLIHVGLPSTWTAPRFRGRCIQRS